MRKIKGYLDEWRVQEYLLITFFISWLGWGVLILLTALGAVEFSSPLGLLLFAIGGFGPTISAILCLEGKLSWKKLGRFVFGHRARTFGFFALFAILASLAVALSSRELNPEMSLWTLPLVWLACTFIGGGNEELGWRGTLQPLLEQLMTKNLKHKTLAFIVSTLLTGIIWAVWHAPLWFVVGSTQQSIPFFLFALSCIILSFWLACLYRRTESVFYCMLLHGLANVLFSSFIVKVDWILCLGFTIITVLSVFLARKSKPVTKLPEGS